VQTRSRRPWTILGSLVGGVTILVLAVTLLWLFMGREPGPVVLKYGEFLEILEAAREQDPPSLTVRNVRVTHSDIRGEIVTSDRIADPQDSGTPQGPPLHSSRHSKTVSFVTQRLGLENDQELHAALRAVVGPSYQGAQEDSSFRTFGSVFTTTIMVVLLGLTLLLLFRWMSGTSALTFGRSRAKLYAEKDPFTFADVAGIDEAVAELREVVDFLKTPQKYQALGGRIPKGVLLVGPPGTGKTLLAKAVAGEARVPFFSLSGSEFVEMFVGVGAARVRDLFQQAETKAPCIVFLDELDALGKSRGGAVTGGHDEREQTLNQLLVEMDGFDSNRGVIIMAATNRPETLDPALMRPGRFDRTVVVDRADILGREAILKVHVRDVRLGPDVDLRRVAGLTPGAVGADLANLVNEAALMAARAGKEQVGMAEFEEAVERCAVGLERKSRIMHPDEKQRVAYHEAGHALITCALPNTHPVHKISIIPRGVGALGYVLSRPDEDRYLITRSELESRIKVALGGTLAEELIFQEISNGATSDLEQASRIARSMVKEYGMSRLGRVSFQEQAGSAFLGGSGSYLGSDRSSHSEQTAREIDLEVRQIIDEATRAVRSILETYRQALEVIARRLMEKEVMDGAELKQLLREHGPVVTQNLAASGHKEPRGVDFPKRVGALNSEVKSQKTDL
jgi:cell division protease FtsH